MLANYILTIVCLKYYFHTSKDITEKKSPHSLKGFLYLKSFLYFSLIECAKGNAKKYLNNNPYNNVIEAIAKLAIIIETGSTPGGGGTAIPAKVKIIPIIVPTMPNPKAKSPKTNTDCLSLKKLYESQDAAVNKKAGNNTTKRDIPSHNEPIPPILDEPIILTRIIHKADNNIFIYFIFILIYYFLF